MESGDSIPQQPVQLHQQHQQELLTCGTVPQPLSLPQAAPVPHPGRDFDQVAPMPSMPPAEMSPQVVAPGMMPMGGMPAYPAFQHALAVHQVMAQQALQMQVAAAAAAAMAATVAAPAVHPLIPVAPRTLPPLLPPDVPRPKGPPPIPLPPGPPPNLDSAGPTRSGAMKRAHPGELVDDGDVDDAMPVAAPEAPTMPAPATGVLYPLVFTTFGSFREGPVVISQRIRSLGGSMRSSLSKSVDIMLTAAGCEIPEKKLTEAKGKGVTIVMEEWLRRQAASPDIRLDFKNHTYKGPPKPRIGGRF